MDFFNVSKSFIAIDKPKPKIGPISGEISIAPITTGIELALRPIDATKIEQIKIQAVAPLIEISSLIEFKVDSLSVFCLKSNISFKNEKINLNKPFSFLETGFLLIIFSSEKLNVIR